MLLVVGRRGITIPSVFVAGSTGQMLGQFNKRLKYALVSSLHPPVLILIMCIVQGDHLSGKLGKPGNVGEFDSCQGFC